MWKVICIMYKVKVEDIFAKEDINFEFNRRKVFEKSGRIQNTRMNTIMEQEKQERLTLLARVNGWQ